MNDGLPEVGIECRDDGNHTWRRTGDEGRERHDDAWYYRRYECEHDCGAVKVKRYDRWGRLLSKLTRTTYTDPGYLVKGGLDQEQLGLFRVRQFDPDAQLPKRKRTNRGPRRSGGGHLKAV